MIVTTSLMPYGTIIGGLVRLRRAGFATSYADPQGLDIVIVRAGPI